MSTARAIGLGCLGLVALLVASLLALYLLQPTSYRITRTRAVAASPAAVRSALSDPSRLERIHVALGPMPRMTPVRSTGGPVGPGGWIESSWEGVTARLTITVATDTLVELATTTGGEAGATLRFELAPNGGATDVTFAAENEMSGLARFLWPFVGLEDRMGPFMVETLDRLAAEAAR